MSRAFTLTQRTPSPALQGLVHPVTLVALALWIINDHVLKGTGPGWLTGKLSDVACLAVVPWMPLAAVALARRMEKAPSRRWLLSSCLFTGFVMLTINLFEPAASAYRYGLTTLQWPFQCAAALVMGHAQVPLIPVHLTMDPTDVLTLPALLIPLRLWPTEHP